MKLLQFLIAVFVVGSNLKWHWTPNGYVAGLAAFIAAFGTTVLLTDLGRLLRWLRREKATLEHFDNQ